MSNIGTQLPPIQGNDYCKNYNRSLAKSNSCYYNQTPSRGYPMNSAHIGSKTESDAENYLNYMMKMKQDKLYSPYKPVKRYTPFINQSMNNNNMNNNLIDSVNRNYFYNHNNYHNIITNEFTGGRTFDEMNDGRRSRVNEITRPEQYYRNRGDYKYYKEEQKKFMKYNLDLMNRKNKEKNYIDINPFNPRIRKELGRSTLVHNTILNPLPNFTYNRYLESQIRKIERSSNEDLENPNNRRYSNLSQGNLNQDYYNQNSQNYYE